MSDLTIRSIGPDEFDTYRGCVSGVFGDDPDSDPEGAERARTLIPPGRAFAAFDGATIVATAANLAFTVNVCGKVLPMAGLTTVTVRPTYRRRGLLRALMRQTLTDTTRAGEPLSGLWASDAAIYGRFGYGVAAEGDDLAIVGGDGFANDRDLDTVIALDDATALATLPALYDQALAIRPGLLSRSHDHWRLRRIADRPSQRRGRSPRRHVITRRGAALTGYVTYRQQLDFADGRPAGTVDVEELIALDAGAEATLWHHLTRIDLFPRVSYGNAPPDTAAPWLVGDRRRVARRRRVDTLWLRLTDLAAALTGRRYLADGALRLAIHDPLAAAPTRWQLTVDRGTASCTPTTADSELELGLATLGSIYLGGTAPSLLAGAGLIRGDEDAIARADRLFAWPVAPWCPEQF